jgi:ring-1,2-phenylacetyl-CoA epoxidase subunit PaaE
VSKSSFYRLYIGDYRHEAVGTISIRFDIPPNLANEFAFVAGQYLTLRAYIDDREVRRSYSICSGPDDGEVRIAVRRINGGIFSNFIFDRLRVGDTIDVMTPSGRFGAMHPSDGVYAAFAAGSGITPILSIARRVLALSKRGTFFLFYGNRVADTIVFRQALNELKDRYMERFSVIHFLSAEQQDLSFLNGRLDGTKVAVLLQACVPAKTIEHVFICGPNGMCEAVDNACIMLGIPEERIHTERFASRGVCKESTKQVVDIWGPDVATATLIVDGKHRNVPVAEGETILDAALRAGADLPYACKGGMCATCRAKIVQGEVVMKENYSLDASEVACGFALTCQATVRSLHVVADFDAT